MLETTWRYAGDYIERREEWLRKRAPGGEFNQEMFVEQITGGTIRAEMKSGWRLQTQIRRSFQIAAGEVQRISMSLARRESTAAPRRGRGTR